MNTYIAITGNVGVGKTSLVNFINNEYNIKSFYERSKTNPYLFYFYKNMKKYSFASQIFFLKSKFHSHKQMIKYNKLIILDRSIYEDAEVFAKNLYKNNYMSKTQFSIYWHLYKNIIQYIKNPKYIIYLKCPITIIMRRIKKRFKIHKNISSQKYLMLLQNIYDKWILKYKKSKILTINTECFNYLKNIRYKKQLKTKLMIIFKPWYNK